MATPDYPLWLDDPSIFYAIITTVERSHLPGTERAGLSGTTDGRMP